MLKRMMSWLLAAVMLCAVGVAATSTATAQYRSQGLQFRMDRDQVAHIAHQNGYRDGRRIGDRDRDNGRRFDPEDSWMFRRADSGYRFWFGSREAYRDNYRDGFRQGYEDGFGRG